MRSHGQYIGSEDCAFDTDRRELAAFDRSLYDATDCGTSLAFRSKTPRKCRWCLSHPGEKRIGTEKDIGTPTVPAKNRVWTRRKDLQIYGA
jgi:hypothetical protein